MENRLKRKLADGALTFWARADVERMRTIPVPRL